MVDFWVLGADKLQVWNRNILIISLGVQLVHGVGAELIRDIGGELFLGRVHDVVLLVLLILDLLQVELLTEIVNKWLLHSLRATARRSSW